MYYRISTFRFIRMPPLANVPAQRIVSRCDKTAMRPFAKLLWTLVTYGMASFEKQVGLLF